MRIRPLWIGVLTTLLVPAVPAQAADHPVAASSDVFTPADVTVAQGDSVTWTNTGGPHNVFFEDNSFQMPATPDSSPWSVSRTFETVGIYRYYCEAHGSRNGVGMSGAVYVTPAGTTAPPPGGLPVSADKTAPALKLSGSRRQRVLRQRAVYVRAVVDEASLVVARAWVRVPRTGKTFRARTASRQLAARTVTNLALTVSGKSLRALRRALRRHTRLTARVTVTARDPAGNRTIAKRRVKLKK